MKDEKSKELIMKIVERIKNKYDPEKVILFGSHAYGNPTEESDIDILIIKDTKDRLIDRIMQIYKIVDLRKIEFSPIVITPAELKERIDIGDHFFNEIITKGKELYAK